MLNEALRLIRVFHDIRQKDLADKLGISNSYLSEIESGKKTPTIELIEKYSSTFKIPRSSIFFFSEKIDSSKTSESVRFHVSHKILNFLRWIETQKNVDQSTNATT